MLRRLNHRLRVLALALPLLLAGAGVALAAHDGDLSKHGRGEYCDLVAAHANFAGGLGTAAVVVPPPAPLLAPPAPFLPARGEHLPRYYFGRAPPDPAS